MSESARRGTVGGEELDSIIAHLLAARKKVERGDFGEPVYVLVRLRILLADRCPSFAPGAKQDIAGERGRL
jgi:hypothetical protein